MTIQEIEKQLRSLIVGEFSSIAITFNDHASNYMSVRQAVEHGDDTFICGDWVSEEEKQKAMETNSVWCIHWYPHTPVGFTAVYASTLEAALSGALKEAGIEEGRAGIRPSKIG